MYADNHIDSFELLVRKRIVGFIEQNCENPYAHRSHPCKIDVIHTIITIQSVTSLVTLTGDSRWGDVQ